MRDARRVIDCGIIPALAGNIIDLWDEKNAATDHPRACGEHDGTWAEPYNCRGSSPRLRGTPAGEDDVLAEKGIIPALAGNTHCPLVL